MSTGGAELILAPMQAAFTCEITNDQSQNTK